MSYNFEKEVVDSVSVMKRIKIEKMKLVFTRIRDSHSCILMKCFIMS